MGMGKKVRGGRVWVGRTGCWSRCCRRARGPPSTPWSPSPALTTTSPRSHSFPQTPPLPSLRSPPHPAVHGVHGVHGRQ
eukprot:3790256-Rhodomonas_salina.1